MPYTLKERNRLISKVKTKYWRKPHNYGVRLPKNSTETMKADQENGNTHGKYAIDKEIKNVKVAYKSRED